MWKNSFLVDSEISKEFLMVSIMNGEFENLEFLKIGNDINHEVRITSKLMEPKGEKSDNASDLLGLKINEIDIKN